MLKCRCEDGLGWRFWENPSFFPLHFFMEELTQGLFDVFPKSFQFILNSCLLFFPGWQSFSNAKLYLACTAAYLAPVPSAICPHRCSASHMPSLLCFLLSSCPKLGGTEVEASVKLSQTNEDAHWSVVCVCAAVRWDCTVRLPWVLKLQDSVWSFRIASNCIKVFWEHNLKR